MTYRMIACLALVIISMNYLEAQNGREKPENVYFNVFIVKWGLQILSEPGL